MSGAYVKKNTAEVCQWSASSGPSSPHLVISRPSCPTRYCTIHWHASRLLDSNTSTVAIHSSVSTLEEMTDGIPVKHCCLRGTLLTEVCGRMFRHTAVSFWCAGRCERGSAQPAGDSLWPLVGSLGASAWSVKEIKQISQMVARARW